MRIPTRDNKLKYSLPANGATFMPKCPQDIDWLVYAKADKYQCFVKAKN